MGPDGWGEGAKKYFEGQRFLEVLDLRKEIEQLQQQNENLKCCGNCISYEDELCHLKGDPVVKLPGNYCFRWQSDGLTQEDRK